MAEPIQDPTPEEIESRCQAIQRNWDTRTELSRRDALPRAVRMSDLPPGLRVYVIERVHVEHRVYNTCLRQL